MYILDFQIKTTAMNWVWSVKMQNAVCYCTTDLTSAHASQLLAKSPKLQSPDYTAVDSCAGHINWIPQKMMFCLLIFINIH